MAKDGLQEKVGTFRMLESRLQNLAGQKQAVINKLSEINSTLGSISEIEKVGDEALFPIGSSAFVFGKIVDKKKIIVEVGSGVMVEKNFDEGKKTLEKNKSELENVIKEIEKEITQTSGIMEHLAPEIEAMMERNRKG